MPLKVLIVVFSALPCFGAGLPTFAQDVEDSVREVGRRGYFLVGYEIRRNGDWVVEIYSPADRSVDAEPALAALRSLRTPNGREQAVWVDSSACPVLSDVANALDSLDMPQLRLRPRIAPAHAIPSAPRFDGAEYIVWGRAQQLDGAFAEVRLSANAGELAERIGAADDALRPCWADAAAPRSSR